MNAKKIGELRNLFADKVHFYGEYLSSQTCVDKVVSIIEKLDGYSQSLIGDIEYTKQNDGNLQRFLEAQDRYDSYQSTLEELRQGRKRSHWIWFIFPQQRELGYSYNSEYYDLRSGEVKVQQLYYNAIVLPKLRRSCSNQRLEEHRVWFRASPSLV